MQDHAAAPGQDQDDPNLWLEEIASDAALGWVRERNAESEQALSAAPGYAALRTRLKTILDSKERIPYVGRHQGLFYNFWRDAEHPRGLWRRTTLEEYRQPEPQWETVLDLDQLARDEDENWVWAGVSTLKPDGMRALVSLSRGGGDAHVVREFDSPAGSSWPMASPCPRPRAAMPGSTSTPCTSPPTSATAA